MTVRAVHHLNCATMCPIGGRALGHGPGRGRIISHCLLVETTRDGLVLIDTGFGTRDVERKTRLHGAFRQVVGPTLDRDECAITQVAALGYRADDVRHLIVTHLDIDHAGGLADFPHAKVHLHAREHAAAIGRTSFRERQRYVTDHWAHGPKWEVYAEDGDTWRGLPSINKLRGLDADIGLVPMHGHTRGHSAVIVRASDRWLVHAGDAYFHRAALDGGAIPFGFRVFERVVHLDRASAHAGVAALRQLRASYPDVDVFCAHDRDELEAMQRRRQVAAPAAS